MRRLIWVYTVCLDLSVRIRIVITHRFAASDLGYAASDLGIHCLLRPVCPNTYRNYGYLIKSQTPQKSVWIRPRYLDNFSINVNEHSGMSVIMFRVSLCDDVCLFVLRFYGPVNPMGSCRARPVYLTTRLLGRRSPLSG